MREPDVSRPARAGGAARAGGLAEGLDLLVSGGGGPVGPGPAAPGDRLGAGA
jgi:hypothetical protein